jgi:hypothetical protein
LHELHRRLRREHGLVSDERDVGLETLPAREFEHSLQEKRSRLFLANNLRLGFRHGFGDARLDRYFFERMILWDRVGDQESAGTDLALKPNRAGEIVKPVAAVFELEAGRRA